VPTRTLCARHAVECLVEVEGLPPFFCKFFALCLYIAPHVVDACHRDCETCIELFYISVHRFEGLDLFSLSTLHVECVCGMPLLQRGGYIPFPGMTKPTTNQIF